MNRFVFLAIFVLLAAGVLTAMWFAWRARARRDACVGTGAEPPAGEVLAQFSRVAYVSTTPAGEPFVRVAAPGLVYRGPADLTVRRDGVTLQVAGEQPVHLSAEQISGVGTARARVGKAVERDGLATLRWQSRPEPGERRELESGFRFADASEQHAFAAAVEAITLTAARERADGHQLNEHTTQEDA